MAFLGTEIRTTPAKTLEVTIVSIPAREWKSMEVWRVVFFVASIFHFFSFLALTGLLGFTILPGVTVAWEIGPTSKGSLVVIAMVAYICTAPYLLFWLPKKVRMVKHNLLKKHGWDGVSAYRVKLE